MHPQTEHVWEMRITAIDFRALKFGDAAIAGVPPPLRPACEAVGETPWSAQALHPEYSEPRARNRRIERGGKRQHQDAAGFCRRYDAVVP
jgi:hypothetical protein